MSFQPPLVDEFAETTTLEPVEPTTLDTTVVNNMLKLPKLTFDEIAESVHQNTFNHIYAIYYLLVDKLLAKRKEQQRLQHHTNLAYSKYECMHAIIVECAKFIHLFVFFLFSIFFTTEREKRVLWRALLNALKHCVRTP